MGELFTIGHSIHEEQYFIDLLKKYKIDYVIDVRSIPYSKYAKQYNRENLEKKLVQTNIDYFYMGLYFGARPQNIELYDNDGQLDFDKIKKTKIFNIGLENIILGLKQGHNIVLMCTEKHPIDCHRAILVARAFDEKNIPVKHILANGELLTQKQLDDLLLEMYFPSNKQMSLFVDYNRDYLSEAYKKRNVEIGFKIKESGKD